MSRTPVCIDLGTHKTHDTGTCSRRYASRRYRYCGLASMLDSQAGNLNCGGGGSPAASRAASKRLTSCSRLLSVSAAAAKGIHVQGYLVNTVTGHDVHKCTCLNYSTCANRPSCRDWTSIMPQHLQELCNVLPGLRFRTELEYSTSVRIRSSSRPAASRT
jgi:hypothetical protein